MIDIVIGVRDAKDIRINSRLGHGLKLTKEDSRPAVRHAPSSSGHVGEVQDRQTIKLFHVQLGKNSYKEGNMTE